MTARRRLVAALIGPALLAATGCAADTGLDTDANGEIDREAIVEATVRVRADGCGPRTELGTGTSIGDGLVITAAHVVAGATRVEIVDRFGATVDADVVSFDPDLDVAALRPAAELGESVLLRDDVGRQGERGVVALISTEGTAEAIPVDVLQRAVIRTTDIYRDQPVERPGLRVGVSVEPGDSGAMVHLPGGGVGIVWSRSTEAADRAWTVDLPTELLESSTRRTLVDGVDTGPCR